MKKLFYSIDMAFSMFSAVPMPMIPWEKENMKYMLASLPLVGAVIGLLMYVWHNICLFLSLGPVLRGAGLALIPVAISGGIHLDGFADTVDALASHAPAEKKREILKDSHAGAFAIIWLCFYMILYFALCCEISDIRLMILVPVLSRSLGAFGSTVFPSSGKEGLLKTFRDGASKKAALILGCWAALAFGAVFVISPLAFVISAAGGVLCLLSVKKMAIREFGGMSGDIAGFLIAVTEAALIAAFVLSNSLKGVL